MSVESTILGELTQEVKLPLEVIRRQYEEEVARLSADANVLTFVPLLAARRVRERMRNQHFL